MQAFVARNHSKEGEHTFPKLIELKDIEKTYHIGEVEYPVLKGINLEAERTTLASVRRGTSETLITTDVRARRWDTDAAK